MSPFLRFCSGELALQRDTLVERQGHDFFSVEAILATMPG
jgi:hypothetical protein